MPKKEMKHIKNKDMAGDNNGSDAETAVTSQQSNGTRYSQQVTILVVYYFVALLFSFWFLFDVWSSNFILFRAIGVGGEVIKDPLLRTIGFTIVGGLLGNILHQIRVLFQFYIKKGYDPRWFGKYLTSPLEGAGMAIVVLSLIRGGVALFGGSTGTEVTAVNNFAALGTGALVGFGMREVVGWLGNLVHTMFTIPTPESSPASSPKQRTVRENKEDQPTEENKS